MKKAHEKRRIKKRGGPVKRGPPEKIKAVEQDD
jgi:hypothetical protein